MSDLRIVSYLPNPRLFKATIAARFSGATIDIVGARPREMIDWLWDYNARALTDRDKVDFAAAARTGKVGFAGATLYKTDAFLSAHPFGDIPAAFGADGEIGVFESNSIMRAAARLGPQGAALYGADRPLQASRIDSFLDKTLLFARETQSYLLALSSGLDEALYRQTAGAFASYLGGIEQALAASPYIAGTDFSLSDIAFVCELCLLSNERVIKRDEASAEFAPVTDELPAYPKAHQHLIALLDLPQVSADLSLYRAQLPAPGV